MNSGLILDLADAAEHPDARIPVLRLSGPATRADLETAIQRLAADGSTPRLLVDLREVALPFPDAARVHLAANLVAHFFDSRIALLARKEAINGVTAGITTRAGVRLRQFWREEAARAWLLLAD